MQLCIFFPKYNVTLFFVYKLPDDNNIREDYSELQFPFISKCGHVLSVFCLLLSVVYAVSRKAIW